MTWFEIVVFVPGLRFFQLNKMGCLMTWLEIVAFAAAVIVGTLVMGYALDKISGARV